MKLNAPAVTAHRLASLRLLLLAASALIGVLLLGLVPNHPVVSPLAGALIGISAGAVLTSFRLQELEERLVTIVDQLKLPYATSPEDQLADLRREWSMYVRTELDGAWVWRTARIDFGSDQIPRGLRAVVL